MLVQDPAALKVLVEEVTDAPVLLGHNLHSTLPADMQRHTEGATSPHALHIHVDCGTGLYEESGNLLL